MLANQAFDEPKRVERRMDPHEMVEGASGDGVSHGTSES